MKQYNAVEYLKIDVANNFGHDKLQFEERIKWFNENIDIKPRTRLSTLAKMSKNAEEPELAFAGLLAYRDYLNNKPSGYCISLDASTSGLQIMSAMTACEKGLEITGLIGDKRSDAYTRIFEEFKRIYNKPVDRTRKELKEATMPVFYGSEKKPEEIFGDSDEMLNAYYKALETSATGAFHLRNFLMALVDEEATEYSWILPDGFTAYTPVEVQKTYKTEVEGIEVKYQIKEIGTSERWIKNCANVIHSVDAYVLRELVRRCMYNVETVQYWQYHLKYYPYHQPQELSDNELMKLGTLGTLIKLYELSGICSIRILDYMHQIEDLNYLSKEHKRDLNAILSQITYPAFELLTVHDAFRVLPKYGNIVRHWYKEILAEIVESDLMPMLLNQVKDTGLKHHVSMKDRQLLAEEVRYSEYGIC